MSTKRVKDAGFVQQHIEKIVLGAGVLVLIISVVLFVAGNPYKIKLGTREFDSPNKAIETLSTKAGSLDSKLKKTKPLDDIVIPNYQGSFFKMVQKSVVSGEDLPVFAASGLTTAAMYPDIPKPPSYHLVTPPVPTDIKYLADTDVLEDDLPPELLEPFKKMIGLKKAPYDFNMTIIAGEFSLWDWKKRLTDDLPEDAKGVPITPDLWAQRWGLAGVVLLRQELDPKTGEVIETKYIDPLPDQTRVLPTDRLLPEDKPYDPIEAMKYVTDLRSKQDKIAQPELPWLEGAVKALPPGGDQVFEGDAANFGIKGLGPNELKIKRLQERIDQLVELQRKRQERQKTRPGRGGGPEFGPDGAGADRRDPYAKKIARIREQIAKYQPAAQKEKAEREAREEAERNEGKRNPAEFRSGSDSRFGNYGGKAKADDVELKEGEKVTVWAADPTMRPGRTYRYKLLVAVINPLYAKKRLDPAQFAVHKNRPALLPSQKEIDAMEWVGPITAESQSRFFFTSGNEDGGKADVYRRVDGKLAKFSLDVAPGDPIAGTMTKEGQQVEVDMNAIVIDIERRHDVLTNNKYYVMIYSDEEGELKERSQDIDQVSPKRKELDQEIENGRIWRFRPNGQRDGEGPAIENRDPEFGPPGRF